MLIEKLLIDAKEEAKLNSQTRGRKLDSLRQLTKRTDLFKNQDALEYCRETLVKSMDELGLDNVKNQFIAYCQGMPSGFQVRDSQVAPIYGAVVQSNFKITWAFVKKWLYNINSYSTEFKIKSLVFLSNPEQAAEYGDIKRLPVDDIINAKNDEVIRDILTNWERENGKSEQSSNRKKSGNLSKQAIKIREEVLEDISRVISLDKTTILNAILHNSVKGDDELNVVIKTCDGVRAGNLDSKVIAEKPLVTKQQQAVLKFFTNLQKLYDSLGKDSLVRQLTDLYTSSMKREKYFKLIYDAVATNKIR